MTEKITQVILNVPIIHFSEIKQKQSVVNIGKEI